MHAQTAKQLDEKLGQLNPQKAYYLVCQLALKIILSQRAYEQLVQVKFLKTLIQFMMQLLCKSYNKQKRLQLEIKYG